MHDPESVYSNIRFFIMQPCSLRLCTHEVVSERFHNIQIENNVNYKNSHCIKFLVFSLFSFMSKSRKHEVTPSNAFSQVN